MAILYIEDSPDDIFLLQRAFKKVDPDLPLHVISDGQEAVDFFCAGKEPIPAGPDALSLVILDLNLPGRSGVEVLTEIRKKSNYKKVPVILFSASNQRKDIDSCYEQGCNAYLVKPSDPARLKNLVATIYDFWVKENVCSVD